MKNILFMNVLAILGRVKSALLPSPQYDSHPLMQAIKKIESSTGMRVCLYMPQAECAECESDFKLYEAMSLVMSQGHIIMRTDGNLYGKVMPISASRNEINQSRLHNIRIIKNTEN